MSLTIVGAGLAGLLAAHAWPQARILESSSAPKQSHKALLRFRSDAVARLTGIDFRRVMVRKGIWLDGRFISPSIQAANMYAQKVTGSLIGDRSIWNLEPVERFIAPETLYDEMLANIAARISWCIEFDFMNPSKLTPIVNTAPLPIVLSKLGGDSMPAEFHRASITVHRYRVPGADVFQTIYFPGEGKLYRASITGSLLILEHMGDGLVPDALSMVSEAFGLSGRVEFIDAVEQKYGKIIPLPDAQRKAILHGLTKNHGIFSLGRFATWRNILLDDVVQDIAVLRRLMKANNYERAIFAS